MTSTPAAITTSYWPGHHPLGGEVERLLGRAALAVDGRGRHRLREAGGQHGVAADVDGLGADLHDAAHDHVVDRAPGSRSLRSTRALRVSAARSTGCQPDSLPLRLPPAVRTASTITAVVMARHSLVRS